MICPYCGNSKTKVVDKRDNADEGNTRRRRECLKCNKRFTTYEKVENIDLTVMKKSGKVQSYSREKLYSSIIRAFDKNNLDFELVDRICDEIEMKVLNRKSSVITSTDLGSMVLTRLKKLDPVAYMRFASIYKGFETLDDFEEELKDLKR